MVCLFVSSGIVSVAERQRPQIIMRPREALFLLLCFPWAQQLFVDAGEVLWSRIDVSEDKLASLPTMNLNSMSLMACPFFAAQREGASLFCHLNGVCTVPDLNVTANYNEAWPGLLVSCWTKNSELSASV